MFLATSNKVRRLLMLKYIGRVTNEEMTQGEAEVLALLAEIPPGFRVVQDLSQLESMDTKTIEWVGRMMDLFYERGVGRVVRVIPDPSKDIGFNILTVFHYRHSPEIITCDDFLKAAPYLE